jgi:hypothetical protein
VVKYPPPTPWQNDLARLQFGVEIEHFLFRKEQPASTSDVDRLFTRMLEAHFQPGPRDCNDRFAYVWRRTEAGPIVFKIDYCPHIIEWSFPPIADVNDFRVLYQEQQSILDKCVDELGLRILPDAVLSDVPDELVFVYDPKDTERLHRLHERACVLGVFGHRYCFAAMAATQVHLNILDSQFFPRLPSLCQMEYLVPLLFSNGQRFRDRHAYCVRPLIYRDSFDPSYLACGVPLCVPSSRDAYQTMVDSGGNLFRDYSFICPTRHGTVEFRSACSHNEVTAIVEQIALRIAIVWAARQGRIVSQEDPRLLFYETCETGQPPSDVLQRDLEILKSVACELPDSLCAPLKSVIHRTESLVCACR